MQNKQDSKDINNMIDESYLMSKSDEDDKELIEKRSVSMGNSLIMKSENESQSLQSDLEQKKHSVRKPERKVKIPERTPTKLKEITV